MAEVESEKTVELFVRTTEEHGVELVLRGGDGDEVVLGNAVGNKRERINTICDLLQDNIDSVQDALCELL